MRGCCTGELKEMVHRNKLRSIDASVRAADISSIAHCT